MINTSHSRTEDLCDILSPSVIISHSTSKVIFFVSDSRLSLLYCTTSAKLPDKFSNKLAMSSGSSSSGSHKLNRESYQYSAIKVESENEKFYQDALT